MSLSGNLRDFDLSYIYQIISQESKTGRLVVTCDEAEVHVVFNKGKVVYAGDNRQDLAKMLASYAQTAGKEHSKRIQELSRQFRGNFNGFASKLLSEQIVSSEDLTLFTEMTLEDLACNLFFWEHGYYRFEVLSQVDHLQFNDIGFSADAITMEAARRTDEWKQISEHITEDTVFIKSPDLEDKKDIDFKSCALRQIPEFILHYIDGTTSVAYLSKNLFFSQYRIMDSLFQLKNEEKIIPLSDKYSRSINAALKRQSIQAESATSTILLSSLVVAGIVSIIVLFGTFFLHGHVMEDKIIEKRKTELFLERIQSEKKVAIASLLYHAQNGTPLTDVEELVEERYITGRDLPPPDISIR
ncbi:MAG: DUF4388 domain-containing protein [Chitinispirillaceae bacterium]